MGGIHNTFNASIDIGGNDKRDHGHSLPSTQMRYLYFDMYWYDKYVLLIHAFVFFKLLHQMLIDTQAIKSSSIKVAMD